MKKCLFFVGTLLVGFSANAQFTHDNAPQVGDQKAMYIVDSNAVQYDNITGDNVTWDYSNIAGYGSATKILTVRNSADTTNGGMFTTSNLAVDQEDFFISYENESASGRSGQGFIFNATSLGLPSAVAMRFDDAHSEQLYTYPFDFQDALNSNMTGEVTLGPGVVYPIDGTSHIKVDGRGTLKLPGQDFTNVVRYFMDDTLHVIVDSLDPEQNVVIARRQYEYYDLANSKLPIFMITSVFFQIGTVNPGASFTVVLSSVDPETVGLQQNEMDKVTLYPNPTADFVNIQLPENHENATVSIFDVTGRKVKTATLNAATSKLNVADLNAGNYLVKINSASQSTTKRLMIR